MQKTKEMLTKFKKITTNFQVVQNWRQFMLVKEATWLSPAPLSTR